MQWLTRSTTTFTSRWGNSGVALFATVLGWPAWAVGTPRPAMGGGGVSPGPCRRASPPTDSKCACLRVERLPSPPPPQNADAGASKTYPQQAGTIRKNAYIVIRGRPCKVADVSTSKTGKHGHAKCVFVGIDIFTGKKMEDLTPSSHNCDVPHVTRTDYTLLDVSDDGFVSLMNDSGDTKDDLTLPKGTDDAEKLAAQIKADFEAGKELIVSVLSVRGRRRPLPGARRGVRAPPRTELRA